jgi:hypothetical protein
MSQVIDIVNFNADASCLTTADWLAALTGGEDSALCKWLDLYVQNNKKVTIGFTGASASDMQQHNPESIKLINEHPSVFEIILRPYSHDIALLRTRGAFQVNLDYGIRTLEFLFSKVVRWYLPPEFMCTNQQVMLLQENGVEGVFIYGERFPEGLRSRIPKGPYEVHGTGGARLKCIPIASQLTQAYLDSLHMLQADPWNQAASNGDLQWSWRDGESSFLIPDGEKRESAWLQGESGVERAHIADLVQELSFDTESELERFKSYPVHSFSAWMQEMRMLGFVTRLNQIEVTLDAMTDQERYIWLQAINSDILSAVEKKTPKVNLANEPGGTTSEYLIRRSERGYEGEEYIYLLERSAPDHLASSEQPHMVKLRSRIEFLQNLDNSTT